MLSVSGQGALSETTITESIVIDGDEEYRAFVAENGLPGEGTAGSPIIWEGLTFEIGEGILGLEFNDSSIHTVIINCSFSMGTSSNPNIQLSGAIIQGSSNISIWKCEFLNIDYPIYFQETIDCEISDCTFDGGVRSLISLDSNRIEMLDNHLIYGNIQLIESGNCTISRNTISGGNIYLEKCNNCTLDGNLVEWSFYSIRIRNSRDITLIDNKNPLGLLIIQGDTDDFMTLELIGNNTSLGKKLLFFRDKVFNGSWESPLGQHVYFVNCSDLRITQAGDKGADYGMMMKVVACENITFDECDIGDAMYESISIQDTHLLSIKGMNLTQYYGLSIGGCDDFRIIDSYFEGWFYISGSSNGFIFNNTISVGDLQVFDSRGITIEDNYFIGADLTVYGECSDIQILSCRFLQYSELIIEERSRDVTLDSNVLNGTSWISLLGSLEELRTFTINNNTVAGEPFTFLIDEDLGGITWEEPAGQIFLAGVSNLIFMNQSITSGSDHMTLLDCENIEVHDTEFLGNPDPSVYEYVQPIGIKVTNCREINIEDNAMIETRIEIQTSLDIRIKDNHFNTNSRYTRMLGIVDSSNIIIEGNYFESHVAIAMFSSYDVGITDNKINSQNGVITYGSMGITIKENNLTGTGVGIDINNCDGPTIDGNQLEGFSNAISISDSSNGSIQSNEIYGLKTSMDIWRCRNSTFKNNLIDSEEFRGISIIESIGVIVANNIIVNNNVALEVQGITLRQSDQCVISACSFPENMRTGVILYQCNFSVIRDSTFFRNENGITLHNSNNNSIIGNLFQWCSGRGIDIRRFNTNWGSTTSSHNTIWNNTFYQNHGSQEVYNEKRYQVIDDGSNNTWYSVEGIGNRWSDWTSPNFNGDNIVDVPYPIHGSAGSFDLYPITDVIDVKVDWMKDRDRSNLGFYFVPLHLLIIFLAVYFLVIGARPYKTPKDEIKGKTKMKGEKKNVKARSKKVGSKTRP